MAARQGGQRGSAPCIFPSSPPGARLELMTDLAPLPAPPYYAVIFASFLSTDQDGYSMMADTMVELARTQPGFLGLDNARGADGLGITVSYWRDEAAIHAWKDNARHRVAQKLGHERWYSAFSLRIARVERAYSHPA